MTDSIERECAFNNFPEFPCHVEDAEYFALRETCKPGEYGKKCGSYIVQRAIVETLNIETLVSDYDKHYGLISGFAKITDTPEGDLEDVVREAIVGSRFPLREKQPEDTETVAVTHADLVFTLMQQGKMVQANAYMRYYLNAAVAGATFEWWHFQSDEVETTKRYKPVTTMNHYDDTFNMRSLAAGNSLTTLFGLARIANVDYQPTTSEWLGSRATRSDELQSVSPTRNIETVELPSEE